MSETDPTHDENPLPEGSTDGAVDERASKVTAPSSSDAPPTSAPRKRRMKVKPASAGAPPQTETKPRAKRSTATPWLVGLAVIAITTIGVLVASRGAPAGKWRVGDTVDVEITLVASDARNLGCASIEEVAGKRCSFDAAGKAYANPPTDASVLKPFTTTDRRSLLAAGLFSQPALSGTLPTGRFSVKCQFQIEGLVKKPSIRWSASAPFADTAADWFAGSVAACALVTARDASTDP